MIVLDNYHPKNKFVVPLLAQGESASAFSTANAKSLARLGSVMACKGKLGGMEFISEETCELFHSEPIMRDMGMGTTNMTKGGANAFAKLPTTFTGSMKYVSDLIHEGRHGWYGWYGFGGSVFNWNPELGISFAYVNSDWIPTDFTAGRGKNIQIAVAKVVKNIKGI